MTAPVTRPKSYTCLCGKPTLQDFSISFFSSRSSNQMALVPQNPNNPTTLNDTVVGFSRSAGHGGAVAPAWLANIEANIQGTLANIGLMQGHVAQIQGHVTQIQGYMAQIKGDIARMQGNMAKIQDSIARSQADIARTQASLAVLLQKAEEQPIILFNSQAGCSERLRNPTAMNNGWAPELAHPNPRTRDQLAIFTSK